MYIKYEGTHRNKWSYFAKGITYILAGSQQAHPALLGLSESRVDLAPSFIMVGSTSTSSAILSQMRSIRRSNTALTLMFSLAEVSKKSKPEKKIKIKNKKIEAHQANNITF